jgi:uncharacterized protein
MKTFAIPAVPSELGWVVPSPNWSFTLDSGLLMDAGPQTDLFYDPAGPKRQNDAPSALFSPPDGSFLLSAKVAVEFAGSFDAGCLQIRVGNENWAKLCFEYSPQGQPMVVSVVTRGVSDDCNSSEINGNEIYLRIARSPRSIAFHYSHDGQKWSFVRHLSLGQSDDIKVGFSVQAPRGDGCRAAFTDIRYSAAELADLRNGE